MIFLMTYVNIKRKTFINPSKTRSPVRIILDIALQLPKQTLAPLTQLSEIESAPNSLGQYFNKNYATDQFITQKVGFI